MEAANNVFARIVLEQTRPEQLKQVMQEAHLNVYQDTRRSVRHEAKVQQPVDQD